MNKLQYLAGVLGLNLDNPNDALVIGLAAKVLN